MEPSYGLLNAPSKPKPASAWRGLLRSKECLGFLLLLVPLVGLLIVWIADPRVFDRSEASHTPTERILAMLKANAQAKGIHSYTMTIVDKERGVLFSETRGERDPTHHIDADDDTVFNIASVTKQFTAMLVGMAVDEGKLDWSTPLSSYDPSFKREKRRKSSSA